MYVEKPLTRQFSTPVCSIFPLFYHPNHLGNIAAFSHACGLERRLKASRFCMRKSRYLARACCRAISSGSCSSLLLRAPNVKGSGLDQLTHLQTTTLIHTSEMTYEYGLWRILGTTGPCIYVSPLAMTDRDQAWSAPLANPLFLCFRRKNISYFKNLETVTARIATIVNRYAHVRTPFGMRVHMPLRQRARGCGYERILFAPRECPAALRFSRAGLCRWGPSKIGRNIRLQKVMHSCALAITHIICPEHTKSPEKVHNIIKHKWRAGT